MTTETEPDAKTLAGLLAKAHAVVTWTTQGILDPEAAGYKWLVKARQDYLKARIDAYAPLRPLGVMEFEGCTCGSHPPDFVNCMYHYAAKLQPDNHRIPWNCPTFYDGCNCDNLDDEAAGEQPPA